MKNCVTYTKHSIRDISQLSCTCCVCGQGRMYWLTFSEGKIRISPEVKTVACVASSKCVRVKKKTKVNAKKCYSVSEL